MNTPSSQPTRDPNNTHVAILGMDRRFCHEGNFMDVCAEMMQANPGLGVPAVVKIEEPKPVPAAPVQTTVESNISVQGTLRAMNDAQMARENGFFPKAPVYQIGTKVVSVGVENARRSQHEHAAKPPAREVANELMHTVKNEGRMDMGPYTLDQTRLALSGDFVVGEENSEFAFEERARWGVEVEGFRRLAGRCIPATGAGQYLTDCSPKLRGQNWLAWVKEAREAKLKGEAQPQHVLRTRGNGANGRSVFGAVSPGYTAFDADKVAEALAIAFPADARGSADYDGFRYWVEGLWHTDVAPDEFVAGEIFKAGVVVRGDDTGSGSIRVQSVIWRNLCLNLIILDRAIGVDVRIRHVGSVQALAAKFRHAFGQALTSVAGFRTAWTRAMNERDQHLITRTQGTTSDDITGLPASAVLAGIFNGMLKRDLVTIRGNKPEIVRRLVELHSHDEAADQYGVSRASIVNTLTRYAHQVEQDPFDADVIREDAGRLLGSRGNKLPAPLPYEAPVAKRS